MEREDEIIVRVDELVHEHRGILLCDAVVWERLQKVAAHHPNVAVLLPGHVLFESVLAVYHQYEFSQTVCVLLSSAPETQALFRMCEAYGVSNEVLWENLFS